MDLNFTAAEEAFRAEVREFARQAVPADAKAALARGEHVTRDDILAWQQRLHARGWGAPNWPREFGGTGWDAIQQHIFEEETALAGAPRQLPFGLRMVGPVLIKFGAPHQQQRFLPRIPSAEDWWCQGYSEPGAGSDLAALSTRAERRGDRYVVNGQKTWTTLAQYADWIFCLVRTDPQAKKQEGISFLLIDMKSKGVTVRPIILLDGAHEVNEVWFDEVEVPVEQRIGAENQGWTIAKYLLEHERTNIAGIGFSKRELARVQALARSTLRHGRPLIEDPLYRARLAEVEIDLMALEITNLRVLSEARARGAPGPLSSMLKIKGSEIYQRIAELGLEARGPAALEGATSVSGVAPTGDAAFYLNLRKVTIYGGSNEIQRQIIAKHVLEL
jgi:alkylation response protein AidB-like acyl-CoA dehydrogenase